MKKMIRVLFAMVFTTGISAQTVKTLSPGKPEENGLSPERLARIDMTLNEYVAKGYIPGAVALIIRNGKIVYEKSFGFSDMESKTALKTDNIFRIASQSKAITSLAVMMLWEEGKFLLDEPVSKYIPEFKNPRVLVTFNEKDSSYTTVPAKSEITIRQVLTHSSGISYAAIGTKEFNAIYAKAHVPSGIGIGNTTDALADKMKILGTLPLRHHPGEEWTYGLNTDLLGYLVEVLSGLSFNDFLQQRIFKPLGMNDTYFYLPKEKYNRMVSLYESKDNKLSKPTAKIYDNVDPNYPNTAGKYFSGGAGLSSTVENYAKFLQLFLNQGEFNGVRLISRKTVELMMTAQLQPPITEKFGLGFGLETPENDYKSPYSLGSFSWGGAFSTTSWADPKEKLISLIFTNIYNNKHGELADKYKALVYQSIVD